MKTPFEHLANDNVAKQSRNTRYEIYINARSSCQCCYFRSSIGVIGLGFVDLFSHNGMFTYFHRNGYGSKMVRTRRIF
jgi:hypothetical protein